MELIWWPVTAAALCAVAGCVIVALVLPMTRSRGRLRPLAHVERLTRLPEYARIRRRETIWAATILALLLVLFGTAALTAGRPSGSGRDFDALHPEDIMLCVANPVTDASTAQFLDYFARQAATFDTQRIGLTSTSVRVLPLTRDHQYAATTLGRYAGAAKQDTAGFTRPVAYTDYATNLRDTLALCLTGFGTPPTPSAHRRSLIYLGPSTFGTADDRSMVSDQQITDMADEAGVQINAVVPVDVTDAAHRGDDELTALTTRSGGRFTRYRASGPDTALTGDLDAIRANVAPVVLPGGVRITGQRPDDPTALLIVGLTVGAAMSVALAVARR